MDLFLAFSPSEEQQDAESYDRCGVILPILWLLFCTIQAYRGEKQFKKTANNPAEEQKERKRIYKWVFLDWGGWDLRVMQSFFE